MDSRAISESKDDYGRNALHLALENGRWGEDYGAVMLIDEKHFKGLWVDLDPLEGLEDKLLFLLQTHCDPAAKDDDGDTVADYAEMFELTEVWSRALTRFYTNPDMSVTGEDVATNEDVTTFEDDEVDEDGETNEKGVNNNGIVSCGS